ncbi:hypothetical protein RchiOBHm_Chr3g0490831 [Rosa chinensis]|uniref:Uncharacterized protein n=1 Tax=Rosa chinensis TaxID=74649 RepID=A0A2P6RG32_ROSCH|nr:hypothetical protein RchiOBHm_Chr3g0490831 [Rosa chinensis]
MWLQRLRLLLLLRMLLRMFRIPSLHFLLTWEVITLLSQLVFALSILISTY